jgi:class 3 adenylate cyclase/predicted ATPase
MLDARAARSAERRQLSVMFCDLVNSTPLSARLDPEDLGEVIRGYQARVAETIARFEGFIALYIGDGVLIYFGWPEAHEADAERAVRAALAVVASVGETPIRGEMLQMRIGVATGLVVVGEAIGIGEARQQAVVGETPNRAARLQGLAGPNEIAIDVGTRQQLGRLFECRDLGAVVLKGLPEPVHTWIVQGESEVASRFEALRASQLTPLIGREEELDLLLRRWRQAMRGEGKVVLLSGEPGIGKSRLIAALEERLQGERCTRLRYFCSPYHQDSPLYPIIGQLERAAGFTRGEDAQDKIDRLQMLLAGTTTSDEDTVLLADLLSIPTEGVLPGLSLSPHQRKERTLAALVAQIEALTHAKPVLMLVEDAHWADPSSRELFDLVIGRLAGLPMLLAMTFRPEFQAPWIGRAGVSVLTLNRFERRETAAMAAEVAARTIPAELLDRIVAQTDGVPLFIEELTRAVLEAGLSPIDGAPRSAVPGTLQASLIARLDQIPAAKTAAQIGAVIGRSFAYELIAAVAQLPEPALLDGLQQLVGSGLAFQRGTPPAANYTFKHALVQDTVYQTLLRGRRVALHGRTVEMLRAQDPGIEEKQPDLLAHHCEQAGLVEQAIDHWQRAGNRAANRSGNQEAIAYFRKALELLERLADRTTTAEQELQLLIALGPALMTTRSSAAPEIGRLYARARELARNSPRAADIFPTVWGAWLAAATGGDFAAAKRLVDELFAIASEADVPALMLQAHHAAWPTFQALGCLAVVRQHVEACHALYRRDVHGKQALHYGGHDPAVCGYVSDARNRAVLGYLDQAVLQLARGRALADELDHAPTLVQALGYTADLHYIRREPQAVEDALRVLLPLLAVHGSAVGVANATMLRSWARIVQGHLEEGLSTLREGLASWCATGSKFEIPYRLARAADAHRIAGNADEGLQLVEEAMTVVEQIGERWFEPELHRLRGELLLTASTHSTADVGVHFERAVTVAREQGAKLLELRAAISLARLISQQGCRKEARDLLEPVYNWFTEGFDTLDLKEAQALLSKLS